MSGVAIGIGWQEAVAYVNIGCYYLFGIPLGIILGYKLKWGVKVITLKLNTCSYPYGSCSQPGEVIENRPFLELEPEYILFTRQNE